MEVGAFAKKLTASGNARPPRVAYFQMYFAALALRSQGGRTYNAEKARKQEKGVANESGEWRVHRESDS